jgi:hypothetical protein
VRCRNCGTWLRIAEPGQWEIVSGLEVDAPEAAEEPEPLPGRKPNASGPQWSRSKQFTLGKVMVAVVILALDSLLFAGTTRLAAGPGRLLGPGISLSLAAVILASNGLVYYYPRIVRRLNQAPFVQMSHIIALILVIFMINILITFFLLLLTGYV